jgi:lysine 2,3-aminomutase
MLETRNWTHSFAGAFKDIRTLYAYLGWELSPALLNAAHTYPIFVPKKLADKIKLAGPEGVLAKEFLPTAWEMDSDLNRYGMIDPIGDKEHFSAPQLIHRYRSRALFTPTSVCPVHCRYCFRKNELSSQEDLFQSDFEKTLGYLTLHPEISEIIFTGGDPLTLSNEKLSRYLEAFAKLKPIKDVRLHTRYPVILPERMDDEFLHLLRSFSQKFRTLSIAIHANHQLEFDDENKVAIRRLKETGVQLLSQTVLLKGVNDSEKDLLELFDTFLDLSIRPYYLHHPDRVKGGMHFYTSLQRGRKLYQALRNSLPGWAIPHYVIDIPGGHGKISAFNPESLEFSGGLLGLEGEILPVKEPELFN